MMSLEIALLDGPSDAVRTVEANLRRLIHVALFSGSSRVLVSSWVRRVAQFRRTRRGIHLMKRTGVWPMRDRVGSISAMVGGGGCEVGWLMACRGSDCACVTIGGMGCDVGGLVDCMGGLVST
jgi:hypothetical protein